MAKDGFIRTLCITDTDAADFVALAVESAIERMGIIAYGRIVVLLRLVVGDVSAQHEVGVLILIAAVHFVGEFVHSGDVVDDVRVVL